MEKWLINYIIDCYIIIQQWSLHYGFLIHPTQRRLILRISVDFGHRGKTHLIKIKTFYLNIKSSEYVL